MSFYGTNFIYNQNKISDNNNFIKNSINTINNNENNIINITNNNNINNYNINNINNISNNNNNINNINNFSNVEEKFISSLKNSLSLNYNLRKQSEEFIYNISQNPDEYIILILSLIFKINEDNEENQGIMLNLSIQLKNSVNSNIKCLKNETLDILKKNILKVLFMAKKKSEIKNYKEIIKNMFESDIEFGDDFFDFLKNQMFNPSSNPKLSYYLSLTCLYFYIKKNSFYPSSDFENKYKQFHNNLISTFRFACEEVKKNNNVNNSNFSGNYNMNFINNCFNNNNNFIVNNNDNNNINKDSNITTPSVIKFISRLFKIFTLLISYEVPSYFSNEDMSLLISGAFDMKDKGGDKLNKEICIFLYYAYKNRCPTFFPVPTLRSLYKFILSFGNSNENLENNKNNEIGKDDNYQNSQNINTINSYKTNTFFSDSNSFKQENQQNNLLSNSNGVYSQTSTSPASDLKEEKEECLDRIFKILLLIFSDEKAGLLPNAGISNFHDPKEIFTAIVRENVLSPREIQGEERDFLYSQMDKTNKRNAIRGVMKVLIERDKSFILGVSPLINESNQYIYDSFLKFGYNMPLEQLILKESYINIIKNIINIMVTTELYLTDKTANFSSIFRTVVLPHLASIMNIDINKMKNSLIIKAIIYQSINMLIILRYKANIFKEDEFIEIIKIVDIGINLKDNLIINTISILVLPKILKVSQKCVVGYICKLQNNIENYLSLIQKTELDALFTSLNRYLIIYKDYCAQYLISIAKGMDNLFRYSISESQNNINKESDLNINNVDHFVCSIFSSILTLFKIASTPKFSYICNDLFNVFMNTFTMSLSEEYYKICALLFPRTLNILKYILIRFPFILNSYNESNVSKFYWNVFKIIIKSLASSEIKEGIGYEDYDQIFEIGEIYIRCSHLKILGFFSNEIINEVIKYVILSLNKEDYIMANKGLKFLSLYTIRFAEFDKEDINISLPLSLPSFLFKYLYNSFNLPLSQSPINNELIILFLTVNIVDPNILLYYFVNNINNIKQGNKDNSINSQNQIKLANDLNYNSSIFSSSLFENKNQNVCIFNDNEKNFLFSKLIEIIENFKKNNYINKIIIIGLFSFICCERKLLDTFYHQIKNMVKLGFKKLQLYNGTFNKNEKENFNSISPESEDDGSWEEGGSNSANEEGEDGEDESAEFFGSHDEDEEEDEIKNDLKVKNGGFPETFVEKENVIDGLKWIIGRSQKNGNWDLIMNNVMDEEMRGKLENIFKKQKLG